MMRRAPSRAAPIAVAAPRPVAAPVITRPRPSKLAIFVPCLRALIHQLLREVCEFERLPAGPLLQGRSGGMPALDILVVEEGQTHRCQLRRHLARMARMDAIVARR